MFGQPHIMVVGALRQHGVDDGKTDGAAEVTGEVEQAGRVADTGRRQGAERDVVDRHHAHHQAETAQDLRDQQLVEVPVGRHMRHDPGAAAEADETDRHHRPRIELGRNLAGNRRGEEHRKT
ncbi:hypothetical protein D3C78_1179540 [compost metagenome]